MFSVLIK